MKIYRTQTGRHEPDEVINVGFFFAETYEEAQLKATALRPKGFIVWFRTTIWEDITQGHSLEEVTKKEVLDFVKKYEDDKDEEIMYELEDYFEIKECIKKTREELKCHSTG
ncbi:MAG: hypothetical protein CMB80_05735 [Flammeovirgaceae bacterium]|nr:hypothetical protein [Flammeovirgaceae bacterium]|tara:strand:- start:506 stop:838 length:333 start_codon:yes stop_codon:yes gene_type:complete